MQRRYFIVDNTDHVYRVPSKLYSEMLEDDSPHRRPEFAGKRIRFAEIIFETTGEGKPTAYRATYLRHKFDEQGRLDAVDARRPAVELMGAFLGPVSRKSRERTQRTYFWKPDRGLKAEILDSAFGIRSCPYWPAATPSKPLRKKTMELRASRQPAASSWQDDLEDGTGAFDPSGIEDTRQRVEASVVRRPGQRKFRNKLLRAYSNRCAITGCGVLTVLECAHIHPHLGEDTDAITNAFIFRADLHRLYDFGMIAIDERTHEVLLDPSLRGSCYEELGGKRLTLPRKKEHWPSAAALKWHRERCHFSRKDK